MGDKFRPHPTEIPTSEQIHNLLAVVMEGKRGKAKELREAVGEKFEIVFALIEKNPHLAGAVFEFEVNRELSEYKQRQFRLRLLRALWCLDDSGFEEEGDEMGHGNAQLKKLSGAIALFHQNSTWSIDYKKFAETSVHFLETFLDFYGSHEAPDDSAKDDSEILGIGASASLEDEVGVNTGFEPLIQGGDSTALHTIILMLLAYVRSIEEPIGFARGEPHAGVLKTELKNGRWGSMAQMVNLIKHIPHQKKIREDLECSEIAHAISELSVSWDALAASMTHLGYQFPESGK